MSEISDVNAAVETLGKAFEEFKTANDERLAEIEKKGQADPVTEDKVAKLNEAVEKAQQAVDKAREEREALQGRVDELETAIKRSPKGAPGEGDKDTDPALAEYKTAFNAYLRKGEVAELAELESKALSVGSDPEGGYAVTPDTSGRIATTIFETSPIRSIASIETIGTDALEGMTDKDEAGSGWVAETATRTETTTPEIGKWRIPMHELYAEPRATQKLLDDANFNVEDWLATKVADKFSRDENTAFVTGNGDGKPRGFMDYPAGTAWSQVEQINSGSASALTGDGLISAQNALKQGYLARAVWVMKRSTIGDVRKLKDGQSQYLWQPGLSQAEPPLLLGHRVVAADDVAAVAANALAIAFGDFTLAYQIVDRVGIRVLRDPFTTKPFIKFYTTKRVGGDVVNFEAFKIQKVAA